VEVKIGVRNVAREITLESSQSADEVSAAVDAAIAAGSTLKLVDEKGRVVVVPTAVLGYVEIGAPEGRKVGFGAL
jgi:predicted PilT family ATPase